VDPNVTNDSATVLTNVIAPAPVPTTSSLTSSANPATFGQAIAFTATVAPTSGSGTPTGIVTFTDGSTTLAAAFTTSSLSVGGPHHHASKHP